jgi:hypothetical protein
LVRPFTLKEIEDALMGMDTIAAPGPDGLPVGSIELFGQK